MVKFKKSLNDWPSDRFKQSLTEELQAMKPSGLPLREATQQGGIIDENRLEPSLLKAGEEQGAILARVGVFFTEIVAGCNCGDEPLSVNSYCELEVRIDRQTAATQISLVSQTG